MPSFRSAKSQAEHQIKAHSRMSQPKFKAKGAGIFSKGTARNYQQALTTVSTWMKNNKTGHSLSELTVEGAKSYLIERQSIVSQSTLNQERQALQLLLGKKLPTYKAAPSTKPLLAERSRVYSQGQLAVVLKELTPTQAFAVLLTREAGLRAHELLTIRPITEQRPSSHRDWHAKQFKGVGGERYSVVGKGGLVREIRLSTESAKKLESYRLVDPVLVIDRGIKYQSYYALPAGQRLSQAFTTASNGALGWSRGLHSTRHMYAQQRMLEMMKQGSNYKEALSIVSQNLAHFRPEITETYLR